MNSWSFKSRRTQLSPDTEKSVYQPFMSNSTNVCSINQFHILLVLLLVAVGCLLKIHRLLQHKIVNQILLYIKAIQ